MSDEANTPPSTIINTISRAGNNQAWTRWAVGLALLVVGQFGTAIYVMGTNASRIENNTRRIEHLEILAEELQKYGATKDQVREIQSDIREVKVDVKDINKSLQRR